MRLLAVLLALLLSASPALADFYGLLAAARTGDLDAVRAALEAGDSPNRPEWDDGYTPLMFAAGDGNAEMTRLLLAAGAQPEDRDHNGERALIWAARWGHAETVALLLEAGAAPDSDLDPYGETPLMETARYGHVDVARLLLDAGADPGRRDQGDGTALHQAALAESAELVALLLERGADVDAQDSILLDTALHIAAARTTPEVVEILLAAGARVDLVNDEGKTALHWAAMRAQRENVAALIAAGADVDAAPAGRDSPIVAAMSPVDPSFGDPAGTALLLAPHTKDIDTAFATAIWNGFTAVAQVLLARGADIDAANSDGQPALAGAATHQGIAMFEALLAAGADLSASGPAALLVAAQYGHDAMVGRLLLLNVPIDSRNEIGATPLLYAAEAGHIDTVRLLLARGADPHATDSGGRGAEHYMALRPDFLTLVIQGREASRAYMPTYQLRADREALRCRHAVIGDILGLPPDPDAC